LMDTKFRCFMEPEVVMRRRKFSREFKIEAVRLVRERGVSVAVRSRSAVSLSTSGVGGPMQAAGRFRT
jgi:transposase